MITVIDYGLGNLGSVKNMLKRIGYECIITSDKDLITESEKIILPGVGSFDKGIRNLKELGLWEVMSHNVVKLSKPFLGICLGMQLMFEQSEEGVEKGYGWINGFVSKFEKSYNGTNYKIPHMGWNIGKVSKESPLLNGLYDSEQKYYFVHSYYVTCNNEDNLIMKTNYGIEFASAVQKDNMFGVQFHPEKSHRYGMQILKNFCELV